MPLLPSPLPEHDLILLCQRGKITHQHTHIHTQRSSPFLEEMSLARSSLRLARESASSRGKALSWGAERLCWSWDSSTVWTSASSRAATLQEFSGGEADEEVDSGSLAGALPSEGAGTER